MATDNRVANMARSAEQWATNNKTQAACALAAAVGAGLAFWRLKARDHPSVPVVSEGTLSKNPFLGHSLHFAQWDKDNTFHVQMEQIINHSSDTAQLRKDGLICLTQPRLAADNPNLVVVVQPSLIDFIWNHYEKGGSFINDFEELLGTGIFRSNGQQWSNHRKVAARMFSMRNLTKFMFECGQRAAIATCDKVFEVVSKNKDDETRASKVDIFELLGRFTMDSFVEICFGQRLGIIEMFPKRFPFSDAFDFATDASNTRVVRPWWKLERMLNIGRIEPEMKKATKVMNEFVDEMLALDRKAELHDTMSGSKHDVISLYKEHVPDMTDSELRDMALNMIIAGRDTTRCLLGWTLAMLFVKHPEWLEKVREEINAIDSVELTHEQCKNKMKITECVLLETLRLYPSVPFSASSPSCDLELPNGFTLRKGEQVLIHHWSQARNTDLYGEDACEFKPMRWKEKGLNTFPPSVFGAFHVKPRVCLGRHFALTEAKTFLFYFLRRFDIVTDEFPKMIFSTVLNMEPWLVNVKAI